MSRGLQLDDILSGRCRPVCSRRSGLANRPPTTAITLFAERPHAKTRDQQNAWENSNENGLSWRSRFFPLALTPKSATFDPLGKNRMGNGLSWRFPTKKRSLRQTRRLSTALGNFQRNPFILAIAKPIAIQLAKSFRLGKPFGLAKPQGLAPLHLQNHLRSLRISDGTRYKCLS